MAGKFVTTWFYAGLGKYNKDKEIFRTKIEEFRTDRNVDFDEYSDLLADKYNELGRNGYDVVSVPYPEAGQGTNT